MYIIIVTFLVLVLLLDLKRINPISTTITKGEKKILLKHIKKGGAYDEEIQYESINPR